MIDGVLYIPGGAGFLPSTVGDGKPPSRLFLYWVFITSAVLAFFLLVAAVTPHCARNMDEGFLISTRAESLFKLIYYIKIHIYIYIHICARGGRFTEGSLSRIL